MASVVFVVATLSLGVGCYFSAESILSSSDQLLQSGWFPFIYLCSMLYTVGFYSYLTLVMRFILDLVVGRTIFHSTISSIMVICNCLTVIGIGVYFKCLQPSLWGVLFNEHRMSIAFWYLLVMGTLFCATVSLIACIKAHIRIFYAFIDKKLG